MIRYLLIHEHGELPGTPAQSPYRCVVVIDKSVSVARQSEISKWLVNTGCLYMMAWGPDCTTWDDSVDYANMDQFNHGEIPEHAYVMTTWHDNETLEEVFDFAKRHANHPVVELKTTLILHIAERDRGNELISKLEDA